MPIEEEGRPRSAELEQAIKHRIMQRTGARVQMLEFEIIGNRVVIGRCAPCYYLKQLALQGVLDVMGAASATRIEVNVQVSSGPPTPVAAAP